MHNEQLGLAILGQRAVCIGEILSETRKRGRPSCAKHRTVTCQTSFSKSTLVLIRRMHCMVIILWWLSGLVLLLRSRIYCPIRSISGSLTRRPSKISALSYALVEQRPFTSLKMATCSWWTFTCRIRVRVDVHHPVTHVTDFFLL